MTDPIKEVTLYFAWNTCSADSRQFNQQRQLLHPMVSENDSLLNSTRVAIKIPCEPDYVFNANEILKAKKDVPNPVLTPQGMFLAIALLEEPFGKAEVVEKEELDSEWGDDNDGWSDAESSQEGTVSINQESSSDDEWNDAVATDEKPPDWSDDETWEGEK